MVKKFWPVVILLVLGLLAVRTFFASGYFDGHDSQAHLVRLYQYDLALRDGQILPAWAGDLYGGKGYPVFIFAYPLPYLIAEGFHLVGFSLQAAIKATFILAYLLSSFTMYVFAVNFFKSSLAGFVSALLWTWAPYVFVKMFVTASLGEIVSYLFIPITFYTLQRLLAKQDFNRGLWFGLALGGWIMAHPATVTMFAPLLGLVVLSRISKRSLTNLSWGIALALGLSAWYFFPALLEAKFTHFNEFVSHQYVNEFVPFKRLVYSKWGTGPPGISDNPLSQQIGLAQWGAIILTAIWLIKSRRFNSIWPYLVGFGLSLFLMLEVSRPVWDLPTPLQSLSPPWRLLIVAVFTAAVSAGWLIKQLPLKAKWLAMAGLMFLALYGNRNHIRINERVDYSQEWLKEYTGVATGWNEHLPIWVKETDFSRPASPPPSGQLNTLYYPGWQVAVDGIRVPIWPSANGLIEFATPSAGAKIEAKFVKTPLRQSAYLISLVTLAGLIIYGWRSRFWSRPRSRR